MRGKAPHGGCASIPVAATGGEELAHIAFSMRSIEKTALSGGRGLTGYVHLEGVVNFIRLWFELG